MQKLKKFFLSLLLFAMFCVLGAIVGVGGGYGVLILKSNGLFSSWESLNSDLKFEKIITADAQTVWAQASDEKTYSWNSNCYRENCNQWVEAKEIPKSDYDDYDGDRYRIGNSCDTDGEIQKKPKHVIECAHVLSSGAEYFVSVYYALLDDGKIWVWGHSINSIEIELMPWAGGFLGIIAGIAGFLLFMNSYEIQINQK